MVREVPRPGLRIGFGLAWRSVMVGPGLITTGAMVAEKPKKETPMPAGEPGGGMGDMDF